MADDDPPAGSLGCFIRQERLCGPDCMAFMPARPQGDSYNGQWANCMLLVNAERIGKHLVIVVDLLKKNSAAAVRSQPPPRAG